MADYTYREDSEFKESDTDKLNALLQDYLLTIDDDRENLDDQL